MTIVVGFSTKSGIVVATDSQMTDDILEQKRGNSPKLFKIEFKSGHSALVSRSGSILGSNNFQTLFEEMAAETEVKVESTIRRTAEAALLECRNRDLKISHAFRSQVKRDEFLNDRFHKLLLAYTHKGKSFLYQAESLGANPARIYDPFAAIGSGNGIASAALDGIELKNLTIQQGVGLAAYAVDACKRRDKYCSGATQIGLAMYDGSVEVFEADMADALDTVIEEVRSNVRDTLVAELELNFEDFPLPDGKSCWNAIHRAAQKPPEA